MGVPHWGSNKGFPQCASSTEGTSGGPREGSAKFFPTVGPQMFPQLGYLWGFPNLVLQGVHPRLVPERGPPNGTHGGLRRGVPELVSPKWGSPICVHLVWSRMWGPPYDVQKLGFPMWGASRVPSKLVP